MSDFSSLNTSVTGLYAHRQRIDTIGENISNVDTPGYTRQRVQLSAIDTRYPGVFSGPGGQHGGVSADVTRQWDRLLSTAADQERSRSSGLATQAGILDGIEAELGALGPDNLANRLQQFWNSFDDLANDPSDLAVRNVVLGNAEGITAELQAQAGSLDRLHANESSRVAEGVGRVNTLASTIAELDLTIVAGTAAGSPPNGLIDERDRLVTELSTLVNAQVSHDANGQVRISVDGHMLVSQGRARTIEVASFPDPALAALGYQRLAVTSGTGRELSLSGGSIGGGLVGVNQLVPQHRRALDDVAASLVTTVNALHQSGTALDGSTGLSFFDPAGLTAAEIRLSTDVAGQPQKVAASDGTGTLDNTVARALADLGSSPTGPSNVHARLVADLGTQLATTRSRSEAAALSSQRADGSRQAAAGVNLDEELADLVSAQRAYEASARMVSAIDQMLDTLINRTGLVGR